MYIKEVTASLYPWDLADEGVGRCLDNLTGMANVNSVYLIGLMHWEKRPLTDSYYPHNPKRKYYIPENGRIYYHVPDEAFEGRLLKPARTERDFLKDTDWLDLLSQSARKRGLKVGLEISHTALDTEKVMSDTPQVMQKDLDGRPISGSYLCPNNEDFLAYMRTLYYETVKNHDIDFIQTCLHNFASSNAAAAGSGYKNDLERTLHVVNGGCFCESCREKATSQGYDWDGILQDAQRLRKICNATIGELRIEKDLLLSSDISCAALLLEFPGVFQWLSFRMDSVAAFFKELYAAAKSANPHVEVRLNHCYSYQEFMGIRHKDLRNYVDSVRDSDYSEQTGDIKKLYTKKQQVDRIRRGVGFDMPILSAIGIRPKATPEIIRESIRLLSQSGIDGLSLGHYDGASFALLQAVKEGMEEADMQILKEE